jgi:hypothetical protein
MESIEEVVIKVGDLILADGSVAAREDLVPYCSDVLRLALLDIADTISDLEIRNPKEIMLAGGATVYSRSISSFLRNLAESI